MVVSELVVVLVWVVLVLTHVVLWMLFKFFFHRLTLCSYPVKKAALCDLFD